MTLRSDRPKRPDEAARGPEPAAGNLAGHGTVRPQGADEKEWAEIFKQAAPPGDSVKTKPPSGRMGQFVEFEGAGNERNDVLAAYFRLAAEGRLSALADIYDILAPEMFGYVRSIVDSAADAEDVCQEVFAKLAAQGPRLVRVAKPLAYIFAIARNEAFEVLRKRSKERWAGREGALFEEIAAPSGPAPRLTAREAEAALKALPLEQREVVILKIYEGFTFAEIGELTETSPNTAASRYRYALEKLAQKLHKQSGS